jgi:hypothetical protein
VLGFEEAILGFWRLGIFAGGCFDLEKGGWGNAGAMYDIRIVGWWICCVNGKLFRKDGGLACCPYLRL